MTRGKRHTVPKKELDVQRLVNSYKIAKIHEYQPGRMIKSQKDCAVDFTTKGCEALVKGKVMRRWVEGRSFKRGTNQDWDTSESESSGPEDGSG